MIAKQVSLSAPLILALLIAAAGCPGWPAPPVVEKVIQKEAVEDNEYFITEKTYPISLMDTFPSPGLNRAGRVLETEWIEFFLAGQLMMGKPSVYAVVGTDSSRLPLMPDDGCFAGLLGGELVPLPPEGPPARGCKEAGFGLFRFCPSHSAYRLPLYLAAFQNLTGRRELIREKRLASLEQVEQREPTLKPLGVLCSNQRQGAVSFAVPHDVLRSREGLRTRVRLKLIVDAREAEGQLNESTHLRIRIINR